jgi:ABC-type Fe3+-siderophore transport system permease subunit
MTGFGRHRLLQVVTDAGIVALSWFLAFELRIFPVMGLLLCLALFVIVADTVARTVIAPRELPVGAITALIGAPLFIYLLKRV